MTIILTQRESKILQGYCDELNKDYKFMSGEFLRKRPLSDRDASLLQNRFNRMIQKRQHDLLVFLGNAVTLSESNNSELRIEADSGQDMTALAKMLNTVITDEAVASGRELPIYSYWIKLLQIDSGMIIEAKGLF